MQELGYVTPLLSSFRHSYDYHRLSRTGMDGQVTSTFKLLQKCVYCIINNKLSLFKAKIQFTCTVITE